MVTFEFLIIMTISLVELHLILVVDLLPEMIIRREFVSACLQETVPTAPFWLSVRHYHKKGSAFLARKTARDTIVKGRESRDKVRNAFRIPLLS